MDYQSGYPSEVIDVEYVGVTPAPSGAGCLLPRRTSVMVGKVMEEAAVLVAHDHCLTLLAKAGMEHTAVLSMMEQQFSSMAPQGTERYREIVDAYTQRAADKIRGW